MQKMVIFGLVRSLHDLFTALWVGGILTTAISLMPSLKQIGLKNDFTKSLMKKYQGRLRIVTVISVVLLWITGLLLAKQSGTGFGFLSFATPYHTVISIKHILTIVMILIAVIRGFVLGRKVENFTMAQQKVYALLLLVNAVIGIVVLFLSGFSAALA